MKTKVLRLALAMAVATAGFSQEQKKSEEKVSLSSTPAVKAIFEASAKQAEDAVLPLILRRAELEGNDRIRADIELDLQIVQRWLASTAGGEDDRAAAVFLRIGQLRSAIAVLQGNLSSSPEATAFSQVQKNAAQQLHRLTYDLPANPDLNRLDEICRNLGIFILEIGTSKPTQPSQIPQMRPATLPPPLSELIAASRAPRPTIPAASDPARVIPQLQVSQPLRQQLLLTWGLVQRPADNGLSDAEAKQISGMLNEAIEISAGLSGNAGVSVQERMQLEQQLAESLALYSDRRLRDLARARIADMSRYRQVLGSITKLNLSETNYKLLAPAFEYAQRTPESSKQVLTTVEQFVQFCAIYDKMPPALSYPANPNLAKTLQKPYEEARRGFERSRSEFLSAVEGLGAGQLAESSPEDLEANLEGMRISLDVVESLTQMPQALDTFGALKVKQAAGLEKRISKEASTAASPGKGPVRREASKVLKDLIRVAETARALEQMKIEGGELEVLKGYTKKTPEDFSAKWRSNVVQIVDGAAAGTPLETERIERNEGLIGLIESLQALTLAEHQLQGADKLQRWADWGLEGKALDQTLFSYRASAAGAFLGFLNDNTDAVKGWGKMQHERRPMINFLLRSVDGAAELPELPTPLHTACAKLMTPLATQKYSAQRYFSLASTALQSASLEPSTAELIRTSIDKRLQP